jgi:hypothetical protein
MRRPKTPCTEKDSAGKQVLHLATELSNRRWKLGFMDGRHRIRRAAAMRVTSSTVLTYAYLMQAFCVSEDRLASPWTRLERALRALVICRTRSIVEMPGKHRVDLLRDSTHADEGGLDALGDVIKVLRH